MSTIDNYGIQYGTGELFPTNNEGGTSVPEDVTNRRYQGTNQTRGVTQTGTNPGDGGQEILNEISISNLGNGQGLYARRESNTFLFKGVEVENGLTIRQTGNSVVLGGPSLQLPRLDVYLGTTSQFAAPNYGKFLRVKADGTGVEYVDVNTTINTAITDRAVFATGTGTFANPLTINMNIHETSSADTFGSKNILVEATGTPNKKLFVPSTAVAETNTIAVVGDGIEQAAIAIGGLNNNPAYAASEAFKFSVKVSSDAGNALSVRADGLYVAASAGGGNGGGAGTTYTFGETGTLALTETAGAVTGAVKVSEDAGNAVIAKADGLFVAGISAGMMETEETDTTALDYDGLTLKADVKISAEDGNALVANADGLFVDAASSFDADDSATLSLALAAGVLSGEVKVDPAAGNALEVRENGLFVSASGGNGGGNGGTSFQPGNTSTTRATLASGILSVDVKISDLEDNLLEIGEGGLYVQSIGDGLSAYEVAVENGFVGDEAAWLLSLKGADGTTLQFKGAANNVADLPTSGNSEGDAWIVNANIWIFTGGQFVDGGTIAGPTGPQGQAGTPGATGPKGDKGDPGLRMVGTLSNVSELAQHVPNAVPGDSYWIGTRLYTYYTSANNFVDQGNFGGAPGAQGAQGLKGDKGDDGAPGKQTLVTLNDVAIAPSAATDGHVVSWNQATGKFVLAAASAGGGNGGGGAGTTTFAGLTDTPTSYTNQGGKILVVSEDEDGIEYMESPLPSPLGNGGKIIAANASGTGYELVAMPQGGGNGGGGNGGSSSSSGTIEITINGEGKFGSSTQPSDWTVVSMSNLTVVFRIPSGKVPIISQGFGIASAGAMWTPFPYSSNCKLTYSATDPNEITLVLSGLALANSGTNGKIRVNVMY